MSQQVRTTAENCAAAANAGKDAFWVAFGLGAVALGFWLLFLQPVLKWAKEQAKDSLVEPPPPTEPKRATPALHKSATATARPVAPHKPKKGIQEML